MVLPEAIRPLLADHIERVVALHAKNRLIEPTLHFQALEKSALICAIRGSIFSVLGKRLRNGMRSYGVAPDSDPVFSTIGNTVRQVSNAWKNPRHPHYYP